MNKLRISVSLAALVTFMSCTPKIEHPTSATSSDAPAQKVKAECADGKTPKVIEGDICPGSWVVRADKSGRKVCMFNYGPPISCPEGTKSTTYQSVCYGTVNKEGSSTPSTPEDCESQFGKAPAQAPYRLVCCPQ